MRHRIALLVTLLTIPSAAFGSGHPFTELEIPVPELTGVHARALGMGGAHIAVAEDASAMTWNPACLVNIRRIEISATMLRTDHQTETVWHGDAADWGTLENQLGGLHFLYPFPTYRGSLVIGFGVDRLRDYTLRYKRSGVDRDVPFFGNHPGLLTDTQLRDGKLSGYSAAIGWDAGPRFSLGASLTYIRGSLYGEELFLTEDINDRDPDYESIEDFYLVDGDLSGWTGMLGFLYRASPRLRFGGVLGAPRAISLKDGYAQERTRDVLDNGDVESSIVENLGFPEEEFTFPYWVGFGLSYTVRGLILAADVRHTDWRNLKYEVGGDEIFLKPYYRDGTSVSLGAELLFPWLPLRVRGGYRYDPAPFHLTYIPDESALVVENGRDPSEIDVAIDGERQFYSVGAGYLFDRVFLLDATWQFGSYKRVIDGGDPDLYNEKRSAGSFLVSLGYRF